MDEVVNTVLMNDPQIRAGFEWICQAEGELVQACLKPNPTLGISQTLLSLGPPFTEDRQGGPPQFDVTIAWPIDWYLYGKQAAAIRVANWGVRIGQAEYAELVRRRLLEASLAYYEVAQAKALLELARQDVANFRRIEELTQRAVAGGGRPKVELSRIRLDRLQAEQNLRDASNALVAAKAALLALMGRVDGVEQFDVVENLDDLDQVQLTEDVDWFTLALTNRPDLSALRLRLAQARAETESQRRQAKPEVTPMIGYTRQFQERAIGFPDADSFGFGVDLTLPVHNRNQGNIRRAAAVARQQEYDLQAGLVELRAEITQVENDLRTALENSKAIADEQLKLAAEVRDSLNQAYEAGGRPLIDALDAQRNYRETFRLYIESRVNLGRAIVRFNAAVNEAIIR